MADLTSDLDLEMLARGTNEKLYSNMTSKKLVGGDDENSMGMIIRTVCDHKLFSNALFVYSKRIAPKIETANWVHLEENCFDRRCLFWKFFFIRKLCN